MVLTMFTNLYNRVMGRIVCWALGGHTADWTWAHMTNDRPLCQFCGKRL